MSHMGFLWPVMRKIQVFAAPATEDTSTPTPNAVREFFDTLNVEDPLAGKQRVNKKNKSSLQGLVGSKKSSAGSSLGVLEDSLEDPSGPRLEAMFGAESGSSASEAEEQVAPIRCPPPKQSGEGKAGRAGKKPTQP